MTSDGTALSQLLQLIKLGDVMLSSYENDSFNVFSIQVKIGSQKYVTNFCVDEYDTVLTKFDVQAFKFAEAIEITHRILTHKDEPRRIPTGL
jgi:hypothetical protein